MRIAGAALFLGVCAAMHGLAAAHPPLTTVGLPALAYNLLGLPLLFFFAASCHALGSLIVPSTGLQSRLDRFLLRALCGYALFSLLGYALGLLRLLTPAACMLALALPLLWFPGESLRRPVLTRREGLALGLGLGVAFWLLCVSGFLHEYIENDFAHYYSAMRLSLARGDLLPNVFYLAYFYVKGCGAAFLLMGATSVHSVTLATFFAIGMMGLLTYRMAAMLTGNPVVPLSAALLLLASKAMRIESYKMHSTVSMLLFACPYFLARLQLGPASVRPRLGLALGLLLCATVVALPPAAVFLALPLLLVLGFGLCVPKVLRLRTAVAIAAAPTLTFALMIVGNFLLTGIPEITPISVFYPFIDYGRAESWIPEPVLRFLLLGNLGSDGFLFSSGALLAFLAKAGAGVALAVLIDRRLRVTHPFLRKRLWVVLPPVLALGALCPVLELAAAQTSFKRFVVFYAPLQMLLVAGVLLAALTAAHSWLEVRGLARFRRGPVLTALFSIAAVYGLVFNWTPKLPQQLTAARAFFGVTSLEPVFGHWRDEWGVAKQVDAMLPKGALVLPLQFAPYASMYDSARFLRPLENEHLRELPVLLGNDADAAAAAYLRAGVRYFLVDLTPTDSPYYDLCYEGYGALFDTDSVARRFRVVALPGNDWLLVLGGTDADGQAPDERFLALYARRKAQDQIGTTNRWRMGLEQARREIPGLALPAGPPPAAPAQ
jgi:hypothetical protein